MSTFDSSHTSACESKALRNLLQIQLKSSSLKVKVFVFVIKVQTQIGITQHPGKKQCSYKIRKYIRQK